MLKYTICLIRRGDELLMLNRKNPPWMGRWIGVGGKIEEGETPLEGALREIYEETGLRVESARHAGTVTWYVEERDHHGGMHAFVADVSEAQESPAPRATEEGLLDWKAIDWLFDPKQAGVADHFARFAPVMLQEVEPHNHHFIWKRDGSLAYIRRPLAG